MNTKKHKLARTFALLCIVLLLAFAGWHYLKPKELAAKTDASANAAGVATVTTIRARLADVPVRLTANGYVSSLNSVEIRPQVSNVVAKVHIKEGQFVRAGELLFSLDDRADRVNLQKAEAQLAKDKASLTNLERQLARSRDLLAKGFIAESAVDTVQAQVDAQRATVEADIAAINAERVNLSYQTIRATASGRAGAINVFPGSLVQPASPPLVVISQLDPIGVTFTLPETELNALLEAQKTGGAKVTASARNGGAPVEGSISFIDNTVDPQNGTIKVKATFPNANEAFWPGQYVTVATVVREIRDAVVIPQDAVITGVDASSVYVVGPDGSARQRKIEPVYPFGAQVAVKGVQPDDTIVIDGKQNLRPGMRVREAAPQLDRKPDATNNMKNQQP